MPKPKATRESFDAAWHEWNDCPAGPKKQRLLNVIVKTNYPLVQKFVDRLMRRTAVHCDIEDVMQAGLIGMLTAIKKYDPKRPTRFSTMCWPWVRHEVANMTVRQTPIYRPKGTGMPYKEHRRSEVLEAVLGRDVSAEDLGVKPELLEKWRSVVFHFVPMNEVKEHATEENLGAYRHSDAMRDTKPLADEMLDDAQTNAKLTAAIKKLTPTEYKILIEDSKSWPKSVTEAIRIAAIEKMRKFLQEV